MTAGILALSAIAQEGPDVIEGSRISVFGMLIVFVGLVVLTLVLPLLRKFLERIENRKAGQVQSQAVPQNVLTEEDVAAAVCAINAHLASIEQIEHMRLTLGLSDKPYRPWRLAGRAEVLLGRQSLGSRPRNRSF